MKKRNCPHYKALYYKELERNRELMNSQQIKAVGCRERNRYELVPVNFEKVSGQTEKAWAIQFTKENDDYSWFPKSQCVFAGPNTIMAPYWLVLEKELGI